MINALKRFFEQNISVDKTDDIEHKLKLATAALLVEMMQQDMKSQVEEELAVKKSLMSKFDLTDDETDQLLELAHQEAKQATDYYQFTSLINSNFDYAQKLRVVEYLWHIAFADAHLDMYEEHMVRHIAELIHVSHTDFIRLKHKVINA